MDTTPALERCRNYLRLLLATGLMIVTSAPISATTPLGAFGQSTLQQNTGDSVQITCGGLVAANGGTPPVIGSVPLYDTCNAMVQTANQLNGVTGPGAARSLNISADELAASLQQIATEEFAATESMANEITTNQTGNVLARLVEVRRNVRGFSLANLTYPGKTPTLASRMTDFGSTPDARGGSASADDSTGQGKLGAFVSGSYSTGDRDETLRTDSFDFDTYGVTAGLDYRFTPNLVLGGALSYHNVDTDFDKVATVNGGNVDADGWGGFVYGTYYYGERFYVDGLAGYAKSDYDTKRKISIPSNSTNPTVSAINETAKGSPDSDDYVLSAGAGYNLNRNELSYGPFARVSYYKVDIDDYTEKGAESSGLNLHVDGQDWTSLTSVLGVQLAYASSQSFGVLVPQGRAGWVHEYKNASDNITAVYVDDPNQNVLLAQTDKPDRDYFEVGLGVSATFRNGIQAFFNYDTVLGLSNLTEHLFTVGGRAEF